MGRKRYPSDQRRYFRVESPELADSTTELTDAEFRAFILILAWANETKAQERGDWVAIARNRLPSVAPNRRGSVSSSARVVRELCAKQSWELHESDVRWEIHVRNWSEYQGFTPSTLRPHSASRASDPTPTPTPTKKREEKKEANADALDGKSVSRSPLLNLLSGPGVEDDEKQAWFENQEEGIAAEAELEAARASEDRGESVRKAAVKRTTIRYWKHYLRGEREYRGAGKKNRERSAAAAWEAEHGAEYAEEQLQLAAATRTT